MVHIYYGDGKGKTTAAAGLAVRAAGSNMKVMFVQFLKTEFSGERSVLKTLENVTVTSCPLDLKFTFDMTEAEKQQTSVLFRGIFERSATVALAERYDMIVLDEIFDVINEGMLSSAQVLEFITNAPNSIEIVMTGHNPPESCCEEADDVTEMKKINHPFDKGLTGRIGIEF